MAIERLNTTTCLKDPNIREPWPEQFDAAQSGKIFETLIRLECQAETQSI